MTCRDAASMDMESTPSHSSKTLVGNGVENDMNVVEELSTIETIDAASLTYEVFSEVYLSKCRPVVLKNIYNEGHKTKDGKLLWRAAQEWVINTDIDIDFMEQNFGTCLITATDTNKKYKGCGTSQEMTMTEFCQWWKGRKYSKKIDDRLLYLKDWHFVSEFPTYNAYENPSFFQDDWLNEWYDQLTNKNSSKIADYRFVYIGPAGSSTPLHTDVLLSHSWSTNLSGRKKWTLLPPKYSNLVKNRQGNAVAYDFDADMESEEAAKEYPGLKIARHHVIELIQSPGEAIFVPSAWYHTVENLDDCLSINHNWISSHSIRNSWYYLQNERENAARLIDDCREICSPNEFERLIQRNVKMNLGMDYYDFGDMVRYIANVSIEKALNALADANNIDGEEGCTKNRSELFRYHFERAKYAKIVLDDLILEEETILALADELQRNTSCCGSLKAHIRNIDNTYCVK